MDLNQSHVYLTLKFNSFIDSCIRILYNKCINISMRVRNLYNFYNLGKIYIFYIFYMVFFKNMNFILLYLLYI